jgi:ppGpp synthetase/RelA/SpoT-type nucleotidyltranferase
MPVTRATLRRHYRAQYLRFERAQDNLTQIINSVLEDLGPSQNIRPTPLVEHSVKEFVSFWEKAQEFEREGRVSCADDCFVEIHDLARARVICQTIGDAERIRRLMEERDNILFTNAKVQVHAPGPGVVSSGYRAIHLDLEIDAPFMGKQVATPCELQVVTALQYAWGLYTHKDFYKSENVPPLVGDLMSELSNLLNVADQVAGHLIKEVESRAA